MPKETLKTLDRDAERLLFAGAQVARTDAAFDAAKAKLAPLAPKAPALAKVVEQIESVQKAAPKAAPSELLNLAALMAQVRGAQAAPAAAPTGDLAPLPKTEPFGSPLSSTELSALVGALANLPDARHRPRTIVDAVERNAVRDLRILPFSVAALGDSGVGWVVQSKLLPKLGSVVVPELRASLKLSGKSLDAKKLRVLATIEGAAIKPLLIEAIEKGSPDVRTAGVEELSRLDKAAVEPIALKLVASDRSSEVRRAAILALAGGTSDATLDALLDVFTTSADLRDAAGEALGSIAHARATERVEALLTPDLLSLQPFKAAKADTKAKKAANEKAEKEHREKVARLEAVLDVLASRKDRDTSAKVLAVFRSHKVTDAREAAARSLLKSGYEGAFEELAPSVYKAGYEVQDDFIQGIVKRDPARAFERLGRFLDRANLKTKDHVTFAARILGHVEEGNEEPESEEAMEAAEDKALEAAPSPFRSDPRWVDAAVALLDRTELTAHALGVISETKSDKALPALLKFASTNAVKMHAWRVLHALTQYKDPRIPPLLVGLLDLLAGYWARRQVYRAIRTYDDPALAPALAAWIKAKKRLEKRDKDETEELLQFLTRQGAHRGRVMSSDESGAPWPYEAFEVKEEDDGQPTWDCPSKDCDCSAHKGEAKQAEHRVLFFDHEAKRMPGARCRVLENGKLLNKDAPYADGGSGVTVKVRPGARVLDLEWAPPDLPTTARYPFRRRYYLDLGEDGEEGVRRRLHNIGFSSFGLLEDNVRDFQRTYDKPVTGKHQDVAALLAGYHDGGSLPPVPRKRSSDDSIGGSSANAKNLVGDDDEKKDPQGGTGGQTPTGQGGGGGQQPQGTAAAIQTARVCIELHMAFSLDPKDFAQDVDWDDMPYDIEKLFNELYPSAASRTWRYAAEGNAPVAGATLTIDEMDIGKVTATTNERGEALFDLSFPARVQNLVAVRVEPPDGQKSPTGKAAGPALTNKDTTAPRYFRPFTLHLGLDPTGVLLLEQCGVFEATKPPVARLIEASKQAKKKIARKVSKGNKTVTEYVPVDNVIKVDWRPDWIRAHETKSRAERFLDDRDVRVNPFDDSIDRSERLTKSPPGVVIHETSTHNFSFVPGFIDRTTTGEGDTAHVDTSIHYVVDYDGFALKTIDEHYRSNHAAPESVWQTRVGLNHFTVGIETMHTDGTPPATATVKMPRRFTKEQYDTIIRLLTELRSTTDGYPILKRRVVGHLDVKLGKGMVPQKAPGHTIDYKNGTLTDKPTCPGPMFEWERLEKAGVALAPDPKEGTSAEFPFFSDLFAVTLITPGTKSPAVKEIKQLLFDIGYSVTLKRTERDAIDDEYDGVAIAAVTAFQRHYFSGQRRTYKLFGTGNLDAKKPAEGTLDATTVRRIIAVYWATKGVQD